MLNLGFSSSFRTNFDLFKEEEINGFLTEREEREPTEKIVNFYEISDKNAEIQSNFLHKNKHFTETSLGSREYSRKSSVNSFCGFLRFFYRVM